MSIGLRKNKFKILLLIVAALVMIYFLGAILYSDAKKINQHFSTLEAPKGIKYTTFFTKGNNFNYHDVVSMRVEATEEMSFTAFEEKLYESLDSDFTLSSIPRHRLVKMIEMDSSNKNFCRFTASVWEHYPGEYPYEKVGYSASDNCPLVRPYWMLRASWAFEQKESSKLPGCKTLHVIVESNHLSFTNAIPSSGLFWADVFCTSYSPNEVTEHMLKDSACKNSGFCD